MGPGLFISHFGTVIVNPQTRLGSHCNLGHGVTIGSGGRGEKDGDPVEGVPVIGDRVYIGPGACLFGPIEIGDDVAVGANAVVTQSLPARAVAVGIPARIVNRKGSFAYVNYLGMESDAARAESFSAAGEQPPEEPSALRKGGKAKRALESCRRPGRLTRRLSVPAAACYHSRPLAV